MKTKKIVLILLISGALVAGGCFGYMQRGISMDYKNVHSIDGIIKIFPASEQGIQELVAKAKKQTLEKVSEIIAIPHAERTFENTALALDRAASFDFSIPGALIGTLLQVSPRNEIREAARRAQIELSQFSIDTFGQNRELYQAFKAYVEGNAKVESLSDEQRYFLKESMNDYKKAGLELPDEEREKVKGLQKKLSELSISFQNNINEDKSSISVTREELAGMDDDFINALQRDGEKYILTIDYPIYFPIMDYCTVESTRKRLYHAFMNRAYPKNEEILKQIIALRDELAQKLGFKSYAALNIDGEMAKNPDRVEQFINELIERARIKGDQEFEQLKEDLPASVSLQEGKLLPWDGAFAKAYYKKKHYDLDNREIAKYFRMEETIKGLLDIYQQFFNVVFKEKEVSGLWDPALRVIEVYKKGKDELLGSIVLDLYPRPNKYCHACQITVIPAVQEKEKRIPALAVVLANFPQSTAAKPSLLELHEVKTFFHEFGHAIHTILGGTSLASFSGTNVKTDFVEMPSQMLEEWLWDAGILKNLSKHYQTSEPLSDELIKKIIDLKNFSSGGFVLQQSFYALLSLNYFGPGAEKDILAIMKDLQNKILTHSVFYEQNRMPYSFGHLTGYGARYYGYLWSKVFALDLFNVIKEKGLLNPEIGERYAAQILEKGGSKDPNELLKTFLGRQPSQDAFFEDLGLPVRESYIISDYKDVQKTI